MADAILLNGSSPFTKIEFDGYIGGNKETVRKLSNLTNLSQSRGMIKGASIGNYAIFVGGSNYVDTVEYYDKSLTRMTGTSLSEAKYCATSIENDNYAFFAGGGTTIGATNKIEMYDSSLTRSNPITLSSAKYGVASCKVGNYILFGGGYDTGYSATVDAFDLSLVRTNPTNLSVAVRDLIGGNIENYGILAGGYTGSGYSTNSNSYDTSLVKSTTTSVCTGSYVSSANTKTGCIFAGGKTGTSTNSSKTAKILLNNLTVVTLSDLSFNQQQMGSIGFDNFAIFAGGINNSDSAYQNVASVYNYSLTKVNMGESFSLSGARASIGTAKVNGYALFVGGTGTSENGVLVDLYAGFFETFIMPITKGSKYKFGDTEYVASDNFELSISNPATGYIKYKKGIIS